MDQGVAAVVAAGSAFTAALAGSFIGAWVGRRQVRDQAHVEHDQWLRGQRQEAYVQFLAAWDGLLPQVEQMVLENEEIANIDEHDAWDLAGRAAADRVDQDQALIRRAAERVEMLGPQPLEAAASTMAETARTLGNCILAQYGIVRQDGLGRRPLETMWLLMEQVDEQRAAFVAAAKDQLRQTPDIKRS
ncbi:hypothetical protein ACIRTB_21030 [Streptomyces sp. NPDC101158]|uniref:hypothetical protein n=1 Tax=Streptomyces sp. NPDC101158 TaxID=3366117 RepID=UPI0038041E62